MGNVKAFNKNFEWIKDIVKLNKDLIKTYNEEIDEGYFLEVGVLYLEKVHEHRKNGDGKSRKACS